MAVTNYKSGSQIVIKYGDINTDFPSVGKHIADQTSIGIYNPAGNLQDVVVEITYDSPDDIAGGTATWLAYQTIVAGNDAHIVLEYGPTGVLLSTTGTSAVAWIKS